MSVDPSLGSAITGGLYPPLNACVLIDSRMGSRLELRASLNSMHLFDRIVEPDTLASGYHAVMSEQIDACIFGPSLRADSVRSFLADLKAANYSADCAFLMAGVSLEEIEGVHGSFEFPCSRQALNSAIISAIQAANGGELPKARRKHPVTGEPLLLNDYISRQTLPLEETSISESASISHPHSSSIPQPKAPAVGELSGQVSALATALAQLEPASMKFSPTGDPTATTVATVRGIVDRLFPNSDSSAAEKGKELTQFKSYLESLIYEWIQNATIEGKKSANATLRQSILQFFQY